MSAPRNVNDGSKNPPVLVIYGNDWAMLELPKRPASRNWSFEEVADKMLASGFHGIQTNAANRKALESRGLRYATSGRVNVVAEVDPHIKSAAEEGADCITLHVGWGFETDSQIDALVGAIHASSAKHDLPAYIETHRATITQDAFRICQMIARNPDVRLNGDFSHLYCGGEFTYLGFQNAFAHLQPILQRVSFLHGRISNGESMQVDVGDGRDSPHAKNFQKLWTTAMSHWAAAAQAGDLLPFAPELGPPSSGYSITYRSEAGEVVEISDRWEQTLVLKRLAEECWQSVSKSGAKIS